MTTETEAQAEQEQVAITPYMERLIEHMLQNPNLSYYLTGICREIGMHPGTASPLLRRMADAGWLTCKPVPGANGRNPLKHYRFTPGTATMLRKAIR